MPLFKADRIQVNDLTTTGSHGGAGEREALIKVSASLGLNTTSSIDFHDTGAAISASNPGELNIVATNIYLSGTVHAGSVFGVSLDEAYDEAGASAGAIITVDGQPVQLIATTVNEAMAISGTLVIATGSLDMSVSSSINFWDTTAGISASAPGKLHISASSIYITGSIHELQVSDDHDFPRQADDASKVHIFGNTSEINEPLLKLEQGSSGDAYVRFALSGGQEYAIGIDNSVGDDALLITTTGTLNISNIALAISQSGDVIIGTQGAFNTTNPKLLITDTGKDISSADEAASLSNYHLGIQGPSVTVGSKTGMAIGSAARPQATVTSKYIAHFNVAELIFSTKEHAGLSGPIDEKVIITASGSTRFLDSGSVELRDSSTAISSSATGELNIVATNIYLSGTVHADFNTLDKAYDQGGAGAGATITADSGPVQITGAGLNVLKATGKVEFTQNLKVGTPSFTGSHPLEVVKSANDTKALIKLDQANSGGDCAIEFRISNDDIAYAIGIDNSTRDKFIIATTSSLGESEGGASVLSITREHKVGINTVEPNAILSIKNTTTDPFDNIADAQEYHMYIEGGAATGAGTGLAMGSTKNVGTALIFKDTGGQGQGELEIYTKESTVSGSAPHQRLVISASGSIRVSDSGSLEFRDSTAAMSASSPGELNIVATNIYLSGTVHGAGGNLDTAYDTGGVGVGAVVTVDDQPVQFQGALPATIVQAITGTLAFEDSTVAMSASVSGELNIAATNIHLSATNGVYIGGGVTTATIGSDVTVHISGSTGGASSQGVSVFEGDTVVSGTLTVGSGSTKITSADIQFNSGSSVGLITLSSSNDLTFYDANAGTVSLSDLATSGGGSGDANAQYLVLTATGSLSAERVWTDGTGISTTDSGAGAAFTVAIDNSVVATLTGSQFSGNVGVTGSIGSTTIITSPAFSGSLTKLVDGTSYLREGSNITITSASDGSVMIASTGGGGGGASSLDDAYDNSGTGLGAVVTVDGQPIQLVGSDTHTTVLSVSGTLLINDIVAGTTGTLKLMHDKTHGVISVGSGDLIISGTNNAGLIVQATDGDGVALWHDGSSANLTSSAGKLILSTAEASQPIQLHDTDGLNYISFNGGVSRHPDIRFIAGGNNMFDITSNNTFAQILFAPRGLPAPYGAYGAGRAIVLGDFDSRAKDYDHAQADHPTLFIHSVTDPDTNNTQWVSMHHDTSQALVETGLGAIELLPANGLVTIGNALSGTGRAQLELDPAAGSDATIRMRAGGADGAFIQGENDTDQLVWTIGSGFGRQLVIGDNGSVSSDFDHALQDHTTLFIHSITNPDTDNTQWMGLHHDTADGLIEVATGDIVISGTSRPHLVIQATDGDRIYLGCDSSSGSLSVDAGNLELRNDSSDSDIYFTANKGGTLTEMMRLDADVNRVGIGTATPQAQLHATGSTVFGLPRSGSHVAYDNMNNDEVHMYFTSASSGGTAGVLEFVIKDANLEGNHQIGSVQLSIPGDDAMPSCFVAGTKVIMFDGSVRSIEDIKIGDKVIGQDRSINTVLAYDRPMLGNRLLYAINDCNYFVTAEHPFMTTGGWKSIVPEALKHENKGLYNELCVTELSKGDTLIMIENTVKITTLKSKQASNQMLYNFMLDGNNTYYANNYLVHNKPHKDFFDQQLESNAKLISNSYLDKLRSLESQMFEWNETANELKKKETGLSFGFTHESVKAFEDINMTWKDHETGFNRLAYWKFVPLLVEGYKQQYTEIQELKDLVKKLTDDK